MYGKRKVGVGRLACVNVELSFGMKESLAKKQKCEGEIEKNAAVWSIPHRGYCSSFLIKLLSPKMGLYTAHW